MCVDSPELEYGEAPAKSLNNALDQSQKVKTIVEECAQDLAAVNSSLTLELTTASPPPRVVTALEKSQAVESKVQNASLKLAIVNEALKQEVRERHVLDDRLVALTEQGETDRHAALHDPLTGLPNRALFNDRLQHALAQAHRHGRIVGVMFVDLDNFKGINDQYGHEAGDSVLRMVADRLRKITRRDDTICRHGGDEFLYLLTEVRDEKDMVMIARKLLTVIQEPGEIRVSDGYLTLEVGASIGIAISPKHGRDPESLVRLADAAMYEAKRTKSGYSVAPAS